ncbi:hypothetical protein ACFL0Z_01700 [Patescibacteria group bacterium]
MKKYHLLSIVGLILASLTAGLLWLYLINEGLTKATGEPLIFIGLLLIVAIVVIVGWVKPSAGPLLFLFAGVMLSTYSAATAERYQLLSSLILGIPFLISTLLLFSGNALLDKHDRPQQSKQK